MPPIQKAPALRPGDSLRIVSVASPVEEGPLRRGCDEIIRLGYQPKLDFETALARDFHFAGSPAQRLEAFKQAASEDDTRAMFFPRGGYGSTYLLDDLASALSKPKLLVGFSDLTALQIYLWQKLRWVTIYGPMVAGAFAAGPGAPSGYDVESFLNAISGSKQTWTIDLAGESVVPGTAEGTLLGGCITLIETTLGTPWELDTRGSVLLLEDVTMKPYHVDRSLMHLKQAGKLDGIVGIILGDFPECEAPAGGLTVQEIATRICQPLGVPVVWGAAVGHTKRAMRSLPLGVRVRLSSGNETLLDVLEPACTL